jgi:hypothetical protein
VGPARAIDHAGLALLPVSLGRPGGGVRRGLEPLGCPAQGPALLIDATGQQQPAAKVKVA